MLEPHGRTLLFDILKPPEDHTLDVAIATTYTLDLLALLTAPVAFSLFDVDRHEDLLDQDSLTLLESLRRYADKLTVFCHAGHIALPGAKFPQFEFLERCVVECLPKRQTAAFHSKLWILRFAGNSGSVVYRVACLTRNLTFDKCWDTAVTLEGPLTDRQRAIAANRPLADFVAALPQFAHRGVDETVQTRVATFESEIRKVQFAPPEGFEDYAFHPFGDVPRPLPFDKQGGRMLIVSPFISDGGLQRLTKAREACRIVSRPESLEQPGCRLDAFEKVYVLRSETTEETEEADAEVGESKPDLTRGLHAKCFVVDDGWKAHVFTGSANATESAFNGNVEFLVELIGPKSKCGIDALFKREDDRTCLGDLFEEFVPQPKPVDESEEAFRAAVERVRQLLVAAQFGSSVTEESTGFTLTMTPGQSMNRWPEGVAVSCWPVTCGRGHAVEASDNSTEMRFSRLSLEALTAFIAFEVTAKESPRSETFVLTVPMVGVPADRRERLLRAFIKDRRRLLRFLLFLLSDDAELANALGADARASRGGAAENTAMVSGTLLESLLRTLHKSPKRLDAVAKLIEDVRRDPEGAALLPEGFDRVWQPIWNARHRAQS